jgi:RNA polymerase sigma factor (sigma-70 family)
VGEIGSRESWDKILDVHKALEKLAAIDPRAARVVELRFFAGMEIEEIAKLLGVAGRTIKRDWEFARDWLAAEIADPYGKETGSKMSPRASKER